MRILISAVLLTMLGGCAQLAPVDQAALTERPPRDRGPGKFYGGACHYENGEVRILPSGGSVCP